MRCLRPEGTSCISDILGRGSGVLKTRHLLHRRAGNILRRGRFCFSRLIFYIIHLFHGLIKFLMSDSCIILVFTSWQWLTLRCEFSKVPFLKAGTLRRRDLVCATVMYGDCKVSGNVQRQDIPGSISFKLCIAFEESFEQASKISKASMWTWMCM